MGGQESKPPQEYLDALIVFSTEEQRRIQFIFDQICSEDLSGPDQREAHPGFDSTHLQTFARTLPQRLDYHLFQYMLNVLPCGGQRPQTVNYYSFVVALSHVLKGTTMERAQLVGSLASGGSGDVTTTQLIVLIEDLMEAYRNTVAHQENYATWKLGESEGSLVGFTNILLQGLSPTGAEVAGETTYDSDTLERWTSSSALLQHILDTVFQPCFPLAAEESRQSRPSLVPTAVDAPWEKFTTLLDLPSLVLLTNSLPSTCRSPWRLLFSDSIHGQSFSTFLKHSLSRGPCILLVRDAEGHVFGGFTGSELTPKPQFSGDETSFLFSLLPSMQVYGTTGYNTNYLYLNRGQETMPNGLGMGGQFEYFGLWLDSDYGKGHSRAQPMCTTYGSPQLSSNPNFTIDHLEVWGVGPDPILFRKQQEDPPPEPPKVKLRDLVSKESIVKTSAMKWKKSAKAKAEYYTDQKLRIFSLLQLSMEGSDEATDSILDKDQGAKAILELANRPQHSEGLRGPDPTIAASDQNT